MRARTHIHTHAPSAAQVTSAIWWRKLWGMLAPLPSSQSPPPPYRHTYIRSTYSQPPPTPFARRLFSEDVIHKRSAIAWKRSFLQPAATFENLSMHSWSSLTERCATVPDLDITQSFAFRYSLALLRPSRLTGRLTTNNQSLSPSKDFPQAARKRPFRRARRKVTHSKHTKWRKSG